MESRNIDKALDIYAALITGQNISRKNKETREMYEDFYSNSEVYDITIKLLKKLNLSIYEYNDSLYVTAGDGNKVFGYTNDDVKRIMGLRLNRELYMCYFIMYTVLLHFYRDSASYQIKEYVKLEEVMKEVTDSLKTITDDISVYSMTDLQEESFKSIALLWDELPSVTSDDKDKNKASRASRTGYIKLTFNFLGAQELFTDVDDRYYPSDRFKALVENYFEEYKSKIYSILGGETDA